MFRTLSFKIKNTYYYLFRKFSVSFGSDLNFLNKLISHKHNCNQVIMIETELHQSLFLQTFVSPDISAATYYLESGKEAILVDPSLVLTHKIKQFLKTRNTTLKYILLTHIPSSHVLGYLEFENIETLVGPNITIGSTLRNLKEKEEISLGDLKIQYINTRNYCLESGCYVVRNQNVPEQKLVFGGADLIYGGGLIVQPNKQDNVGEEKTELSLQTLNLQADINVHPAYTSNGFHRFLTAQSKIFSLGQIINGPKVNHSLGPYFTSSWSKEVHKTNKIGPFSLDSSKQNSLKLLEIEQFDQLRQLSFVLDLRQQIPELIKGTVINSDIVPPNGNIALYIHFLLKQNKPVLIISKPELRQQLIDRLFNIGIVNILGFNNFSIQDWISAGKAYYIPKFTSIKDIKPSPQNILIDSRTPGEWKEEGIVENARCVYFPQIEEDIDENIEQYKKYEKIFVYCRMGYRARIGASMFERKGWKNCYIIPESWKQIKEVSKIVPYQKE